MAKAGQYSAKNLRSNTEAQNQRLADADPARFDKYANKAGFGTSAPGTIPLNTVSGPAPTPVNIPTPPPASAQAGLEGALTSQTDAFTRSLEQKTANAATGKADAFDELLSALTGAEGSASLTDKAYSVKGGVDSLDPQLRQINADMVAEREGLRTQLKEIEKNTTGLETSALVAEQNRLKTESLDRQAALAVTQLSLQGQYDSAKAVADRAVTAKLEGQKQKIDLLEFIYGDLKDTWSTAEQREFETKQADRNAKLEMERNKEMAKYEQILKQSDPLYQAQLTKLNNENTAGVGGVGSTLTSQPGYQNLTAVQKARADSLNNLVRYLGEYRTTYETNVSESGGKLTGEKAALLEAQLNSLLFAAAQAEGTGALQSADREVLEKVLPNPTTFGGSFGALFKGGRQGGIAKIDDQINKYKNNLAGYGLTPDSTNTAPPSTPLTPGASGTTSSGIKFTIEP